MDKDRIKGSAQQTVPSVSDRISSSITISNILGTQRAARASVR